MVGGPSGSVAGVSDESGDDSPRGDASGDVVDDEDATTGVAGKSEVCGVPTTGVPVRGVDCSDGSVPLGDDAIDDALDDVGDTR